MGDEEGTPDVSRPIRFPFIAAALCAASVAAAAWLFFRYSYMWDVTPAPFAWPHNHPDFDALAHPMLGRYVRLRGIFHEDRGAHRGRVTEGSPGGHEVPVLLDWRQPLPEKEAGTILQGRVVLARAYTSIPRPYVAVDCTRGRWHGASVAGFVVAAWGVFVFVAALRHWLGLRRAQSALTERIP